MRRSISANANVAAVVAVIRLANASVVRGTRMESLHEMYLNKHLKTGKPGTCDADFGDCLFSEEPVLPQSRVLGRVLGLTTGRVQTTSLQTQWQPQLPANLRWVASSPSELLIAG